MKTIKLFSLLGALLLLSNVAQAQLQGLYTAQVPVASDSTQARTKGLTQALAKVMVRVSGSADVGSRPGAAGVLAQAGNLVQEFRYLPMTEDATGQRLLWARFDKVGVDRALQSAGIPVWGNLRPQVLVWIAARQDGNSGMINFDNDQDARQALDAEARARGMPLQLPLMDLQDQSAISAADLWSDYRRAIEQASQRYPHDAILTGRLTAVGNDLWRSAWSLFSDQGEQTFTVPAMPRDQALKAGIDGAQNRIAARYVPPPGDDQPQRVRVRFSGIESLQDFGWLMGLLQRQEAVSHVAIDQVDADGLTADIWVRGGSVTLEQALPLGGNLTLQQNPPAPLPETPDNTMPAGPTGAPVVNQGSQSPAPAPAGQTAPSGEAATPAQPSATAPDQASATTQLLARHETPDLTFIYSPSGN